MRIQNACVAALAAIVFGFVPHVTSTAQAASTPLPPCSGQSNTTEMTMSGTLTLVRVVFPAKAGKRAFVNSFSAQSGTPTSRLTTTGIIQPTNTSAGALDFGADSPSLTAAVVDATFTHGVEASAEDTALEVDYGFVSSALPLSIDAIGCWVTGI